MRLSIFVNPKSTSNPDVLFYFRHFMPVFRDLPEKNICSVSFSAVRTRSPRQCAQPFIPAKGQALLLRGLCCQRRACLCVVQTHNVGIARRGMFFSRIPHGFCVSRAFPNKNRPKPVFFKTFWTAHSDFGAAAFSASACQTAPEAVLWNNTPARSSPSFHCRR